MEDMIHPEKEAQRQMHLVIVVKKNIICPDRQYIQTMHTNNLRNTKNSRHRTNTFCIQLTVSSRTSVISPALCFLFVDCCGLKVSRCFRYCWCCLLTLLQQVVTAGITKRSHNKKSQECIQVKYKRLHT